MNEPCCKGLLLASAVMPVRSAIRHGVLQRDAVEARLEAPDVVFLDEKVDPTAWYPVGILGRFLDITAELLGGASDATYDRIGIMSFEAIRATGTYGQLDFEQGRLRGASMSDFKLFAKLLASIWGAFYNFSRWDVEMAEPDDPQGRLADVHWKDVGPLPGCLCPITRGFIRALYGRAMEGPVDVTSEQLAPDHFLYTICRSA